MITEKKIILHLKLPIPIFEELENFRKQLNLPRSTVIKLAMIDYIRGKDDYAITN